MTATGNMMSTIRQTAKSLSFDLLSTFEETEARLGHLHFHGRSPLKSPHYIAISSRGAVPHLSQDMMRNSTSIKGMYAAIEDCEYFIEAFIEKASHQSQIPPVFNTPASSEDSPLRQFIALQKDALLVLGPRRIPPLPCTMSATNSAIPIATALGFGMIESTDYASAIQKLRPDIAVAIGDVTFGHKPGVKRAERMGDRTLAWLKTLLVAIRDQENGTFHTAPFAPILPIDAELQSYYLEALEDDFAKDVSGLALYDPASIDSIPRSFQHLPRLCLGEIHNPHSILDAIAIGADVFTISFITEVTNAGIALDFSFPPTKTPDDDAPLPLGNDMWLPLHATSMAPLRSECECYACQHHYCAFIQHLLNAREMLGWVLLQLHNHHVIDEFFADIRQSLSAGLFEENRQLFGKHYAAEFPAKTGQGPRVRGYQLKSKGRGEPRKNPPAYRALDDRREQLAEAKPLPSPHADAYDLEGLGFAEMMD